MSSPIHLDQHSDAQLIHAPRRARERIVATVERAPDMAGKSARRGPSPAKSRPQFSGDRAMLKLRRQLALDPDLIPEPSSELDASVRPLLIRLCSVTVFAAFVAWGLVSYAEVKKTAEIISATTSAPAMASNQEVAEVETPRLRSATSQTPISQTNETLPAVGRSSPAVVAVDDPAATAPPTVPRAAIDESPGLASAPPQHANDRRAPRLDSDEIATLVKRGQDFIADGDLAAARLLLRRAAEAGSAEAALTLGTTFDPVVLQRLGAIGTTPDPAQARQWYQRAAELGSSAASQHLAGLADAR